MLDPYNPQPFDGAERLKRFCRTVDAPKVNLPVVVVSPRSGLFDIWKRSSNQSDPYKKVNKLVGIGFTYADAVKFREKRLKTTWDKVDVNAIYYDICPQGDPNAANPFWNPAEIVREEV